jgi:hypothetical protein
MDTNMSEPTRCDSCLELLETDTITFADGRESTNISQALYVTLEGGYDSFVDTAEVVGGKPYTYVLCHECAVRMCTMMGFVDALAEHSNMVDCPCPGQDLRQAAFDQLVREQRERAGLPPDADAA